MKVSGTVLAVITGLPPVAFRGLTVATVFSLPSTSRLISVYLILSEGIMALRLIVSLARVRTDPPVNEARSSV